MIVNRLLTVSVEYQGSMLSHVTPMIDQPSTPPLSGLSFRLKHNPDEKSGN